VRAVVEREKLFRAATAILIIKRKKILSSSDQTQGKSFFGFLSADAQKGLFV
jgi:hypothetical protein